MTTQKKQWVSWEELYAIIGGDWTPASGSDLGGFTEGSIPFADSDGILAEDNANLFWDAAETNLGIGTNVFGATMEKGLQIAIGAAPTGDVANTFAFYAADVSGKACPHFRTEDSVVIKLNQSLLTTDSVAFAALTVNNTGLHILDTGGDHYLTIKPNEDLSGSRILSIVTGDAARTITLSGNPTLADWFDQAVKQASSPTFVGLTIVNAINEFSTDGTLGGNSDSAIPTEKAVKTYVDALPTTFVGLTDTPANYTNKAGYGVFVNATPNALEFPAGFRHSLAEHTLVWGSDAGTNLTAGDRFNTLIGCQAGFTLSTPVYSTFVGARAGYSITTGGYNTVIGGDALYYNQTGIMNVAIGFETAKGIITKSHSYNVFIGPYAGTLIETGGYNIGIGYYAGNAISSGTNNILIGSEAGKVITSGGYNIIIGVQAGLALTTANSNLFMGVRAGTKITIGAENTVIGYDAAANNQTGGFNTIVGSNAGKGSGGNNYIGNTYIGRYAGFATTTGGNNIFIGYNVALFHTTSNDNVIIGAHAVQNNPFTGHETTIIGQGAAYLNTSGGYNVIVGRYAAFNIKTGYKNTIIGWKAGENMANAGHENVFIGCQAGASETGDHKLYIANTSTATPLIYGEFPNTLFKVTATNSNFIGITNLGDGGVTDYASFAANGTLTLHGAARAVSGVWIHAESLRAPATNPAELISHGTLETPAFQFADAIEANQEHVTFNMRIPNRMDRSVAPSITLGWSADGVSPGNCRWQLEYLYTAPGEDTGAAAQETLAATGTAAAIADGMVITTFTGMDLPGATDVCIHCRVTRLSADALDTIADTVELHGICLNFTSNKLGT